jgi:low affinity Fe/Cu permease
MDVGHWSSPSLSEFERLTNQLANINKALGNIHFVLVWVFLLLAAILGKLWGFPERWWS